MARRVTFLETCSASMFSARSCRHGARSLSPVSFAHRACSKRGVQIKSVLLVAVSGAIRAALLFPRQDLQFSRRFVRLLSDLQLHLNGRRVGLPTADGVESHAVQNLVQGFRRELPRIKRQ